MKKKCYINIQRQLNILIPIIESCLTLTPEIEPIKNKLNTLTGELENLKQQSSSLNRNNVSEKFSHSSTELQELEFKLDSLVDDVELVFTSLYVFDGKLKNVAILREKLEAIQEERIDGLTPERIYKLLEKRQEHQPNSFPPNNLDSNKQKITNSGVGLWQKIASFAQTFHHPKVLVSLAIVGSLSLGWLAGYNSAENEELIKNNSPETATQTKQ